MRKSLYFIKALLLITVINIMLPANGPAGTLPFVKQCQQDQGKVNLTAVSISTNTEDLQGEVEILVEILKERMSRYIRIARESLRKIYLVYIAHLNILLGPQYGRDILPLCEI